MNKFNMMWRAVNPSSAELEAASAAFGGLNVVDMAPRLVMVRRAVAACFYTDNLTKQEDRLTSTRRRRKAPMTDARLQELLERCV